MSMTNNVIPIKKRIFFLAFVGLTYILLAKFSIHFATMPEGIAIVWLPNGLLLALFLLRPMREWSWYAFAIIPAEIFADLPTFTLIQALQFALINLSETMLSALLIRKYTFGDNNFHNIRYILVFIIIALSIVPALSAILGALVYHTQIESQNNFIAFWRIWFFGDALGILLLTPLIVLSIQSDKKNLSNLYSFEFLFLVPLSLILAYILFSSEFNPSVLPTTPIIFIPLLIWMVYRKGLVNSIFMGLIVSMIAIYFTMQHLGPFSIFNSVQNTLYLQEFIAALIISTLFFGVLVHQLEEQNTLLKQSNHDLEKLTHNLENEVLKKTSQLRETNLKLTEFATTDSLTHIYNRRYLQERAESEIARLSRHGGTLSLILFDIDHFKRINDLHGHSAGDDVLISLCESIQTRIRHEDIFARIGGEEFVLLLPNTTLNQTITLAEDLQQTISLIKIVAEKVEITLTVSMGLSSYDTEMENFNALLKDADHKLYQAKESGRNRIVWE